MKLSQVFGHWKQVRQELLNTIDKFADEDLRYTPYDGAWSAGRVMLHIASAERGWFQYVIRRECDEWPPSPTPEDHASVESVKALLNEVHADTEAYLETLELADLDRIITAPWGPDIPLGWCIWHVLEHEIHHRGELSLMLGMMGREGLDV